jgi:hypothetical protein
VKRVWTHNSSCGFCFFGSLVEGGRERGTEEEASEGMGMEDIKIVTERSHAAAVSGEERKRV